MAVEKKTPSHSPLDIFQEWAVENWLLIFLILVGYFIFKFDLQFTVIKIVLPIIGLIALGKIAWVLWVHYVQQDFISGIDFVLLEIIPPREVLRSPKAME